MRFFTLYRNVVGKRSRILIIALCNELRHNLCVILSHINITLKNVLVGTVSSRKTWVLLVDELRVLTCLRQFYVQLA